MYDRDDLNVRFVDYPVDDSVTLHDHFTNSVVISPFRSWTTATGKDGEPFDGEYNPFDKQESKMGGVQCDILAQLR